MDYVMDFGRFDKLGFSLSLNEKPFKTIVNETIISSKLSKSTIMWLGGWQITAKIRKENKIPYLFGGRIYENLISDLFTFLEIWKKWQFVRRLLKIYFFHWSKILKNKSRNFSQKFKFQSQILAKNRNFRPKSKIIVKNSNFWQKWKF